MHLLQSIFFSINILAIGLSMNTPLSAQNISHASKEESVQMAKQKLIDKIQNRGDLPYVSVGRQLELLEQLSETEFGNFLIVTGGLNGYWTQYAVSHPEKGRLTNLNSHGQPFHPLEAFILNSAPIALATQQRYAIFKTQIQKRIAEGCSFASIPSGLMGELLDLGFSGIDNFSLTGIDIDPESLEGARKYAEDKNLLEHCRFYEHDAWNLGIHEAFDLIASNGLSIYERDDARVIALYREFYKALKPNGQLITSFLTPPPAPGLKTEWKMECVNPQDALLQKIVLVDILDGKWQAYRTEEAVKNQLTEAGFCDIEIFYDAAHIFPTVVAKKSKAN